MDHLSSIINNITETLQKLTLEKKHQPDPMEDQSDAAEIINELDEEYFWDMDENISINYFKN